MAFRRACVFSCFFPHAKLLTLLLTAVLATGCAHTKQLQHASLKADAVSGSPTVVIMPLDVELALMTASGLTEPKADWTEQAVGNVTQSLKKHIKTEKPLQFYQSTSTEPKSSLVQLEKLHQATGYSILTHDLMQPLPSTKSGKYSRTLGPSAADLARETGADYGLFIFMRDSYASGGRMALIAIAAVAGVGVQGGSQVGFASLVDLKTGDIVWFNRLLNTSNSGDLRDKSDTDDAMASLFKGFPLAAR